VGDFAAVARQVRKRNPGNLAILGEASVLSESSTGVLVSETDRLIAIIGVEDLVVVDTDDVLMITTGAHAQRVKEMVNMVRQTGNEDLL
jgi:mannose-1-phosphate guanylyltransferase